MTEGERDSGYSEPEKCTSCGGSTLADRRAYTPVGDARALRRMVGLRRLFSGGSRGSSGLCPAPAAAPRADLEGADGGLYDRPAHTETRRRHRAPRSSDLLVSSCEAAQE